MDALANASCKIAITPTIQNTPPITKGHPSHQNLDHHIPTPIRILCAIFSSTPWLAHSLAIPIMTAFSTNKKASTAPDAREAVLTKVLIRNGSLRKQDQQS